MTQILTWIKLENIIGVTNRHTTQGITELPRWNKIWIAFTKIHCNRNIIYTEGCI